MTTSTADDRRTVDAVRAAGDRGIDADRPAEVPAAGWKDVLTRVKNEVRDDHSALSAAGVAYFAFVSLVPALVAAVSIYGMIADPAQVQTRVQSAFRAMPAEARKLLETQLSAIVSKPGGSLSIGLIVGVLVALWSASSGVGHLIEAVNVAYDEQAPQGFVKQRARALAATLAALVLAGVAVTALAELPRLVDGGALRWVLRIASWVAVAVIVLVGLAGLYRLGPERDRPKWRWVTPGAVFTLVAFVVVSIGLQIYVSNFGSYDATYGALAAVVVLLLWLYVSALLVIIGAQINAELEHQTARDSTEGPDRPLGERDAQMADEVAPQPS